MSLLDIYINGAIFFVVFVAVFVMLRFISMDADRGRKIGIVNLSVNLVVSVLTGIFYGVLWPYTLARFIWKSFR